jgi:DNA-binding FadR family transcriptional regulator
MLHRAAEDGRMAMFLPIDALDIRVLLGSALEGHRRILAAIEASDPQGAEEAMAAHTETARRALRAKLVIREGK